MTIYDPEYMARLDAWRRGGQVGPAPTPTVFSPGRAQSIPSQSQGTPYGREPRRGATVGKTSPTWSSGTPVARPTSAPTPTQGRPRAQPSAPPRPAQGYQDRYAAGTSPEYMAANPDVLSPPRPMNYSGYAPEPQPGFTSTVTGLDGSPMEPTQFYNQRDALIQLLNQQNAQFMPYSGVSRTPGPVPSAPDIGSLWGQAGGMVGQGWQNPFRMTQPQPGTPPIGAGRYYA